MNASLLTDIDRFLSETGLGDFRFGLLAAGNGRLVGRLRNGRRVWPETEVKIRTFMATERQKRSERLLKKKASSEAAGPAKVSVSPSLSVSQPDAESSECLTESQPSPTETRMRATA